MNRRLEIVKQSNAMRRILQTPTVKQAFGHLSSNNDTGLTKQPKRWKQESTIEQCR